MGLLVFYDQNQNKQAPEVIAVPSTRAEQQKAHHSAGSIQVAGQHSDSVQGHGLVNGAHTLLAQLINVPIALSRDDRIYLESMATLTT